MTDVVNPKLHFKPIFSLQSRTHANACLETRNDEDKLLSIKKSANEKTQFILTIRSQKLLIGVCFQSF